MFAPAAECTPGCGRGTRACAARQGTGGRRRPNAGGRGAGAAATMSTKLISFYQNNPPDLKQREYLRGLGLKYSDAEVGEAQVGRMLALPPAGPSAIVKTDSQNAMRQWLSKSATSASGNDLSHEVGGTRSTVPEDAVSPPAPHAPRVCATAVRSVCCPCACRRAVLPLGCPRGLMLESVHVHNLVGQGSLVAPLLWLPGVLRSQGPWATVMKETQEGTAYGLSQGVDLIKPDDEIPLSKSSGTSAEQQLLEKDRLIGEMERALAKQKHACEQVQRGTRALERSFLRQIDEARRQERTRHEKEIELKLQPLREQLSDVKEDYSTLRKAHKVRVQKAYAQDNFISQYSKALSSVKEQAREIANKEQSQLRNKVGALERRMQRDTAFKLALKKRTETAEETAERKFRDAENKIPKLESQLLHSQVELEQAKRTLKSKLYHFSRTAKDHEGRTKKDQEDIRRLAKENEDLKQQVGIVPCAVFVRAFWHDWVRWPTRDPARIMHVRAIQRNANLMHSTGG